MLRTLFLQVLLFLSSLCSIAQDSLVSYRLNLVRHPVDKTYGYAFKEQNINSPIHGTTSTAINLLGKSGSALISKAEAENIDWAVPPQYEAAATKFMENVAMVKIGGKVGFIDIYNRMVIEPAYDGDVEMDGFHGGLAAVKKNGLWGYIDKGGEEVIPFLYEEADNFDDGCIAAVKKDGLWGAIDITGEVVVEPSKKTKLALKTNPASNKEWREASKMVKERRANGHYDIRLAELHATAATLNSDIRANEPEWLTYSYTNEGDSLHGVVDQWGRVIVPCRFDAVELSEGDGVFVVQKGDRYGAYLYNGSKLIGPCFDFMSAFTDGKANIKVSKVTGWLSTDGMLDPAFLSSLIREGVETEKTNKAAARQIYERILEINPEYAPAYNNLALLDWAANDYNKCMRKLKLAHELDPNDSIFIKNLEWAKEDRKERRKERWNTALAIAEAVIGVAATTYATYSAISGGTSSTGETSYTDTYSTSTSSSSSSSTKKSSSGKTCTTCLGDGHCHSKSRTSERYYCLGSGTCRNCGGKGIDYAGDGTPKKCTYCNGSGKCKWCKGTGKCKTCGGTGKI